MIRPFILAAVLGLSPLAGAAPEAPAFTAKELAQGYRDVAVLAKPRSDRLTSVDAEESAEGTTIDRKFARFGGLRVIRLRPGETVAAALGRLRATGRYEFVEPDYLKHAAAVPNDPSFPTQWGLQNTGNNPGVPSPGPGVVGADIGAVAAWDTRHDAPNVIVAVIDSGALLTHTDLAANLWINPQVGADGYTNDLYGIDAVFGTSAVNLGIPNDDLGHGTHVAGLIGAVGNNGTGVCGVAWKVQIMPLKFINAQDSGSTSAEITCLDFALSHGAAIINASFGDTFYTASEYSALQAVDAAGIIVVAAAGNGVNDNGIGQDLGLTPFYPASYALNNLIVVAASDNRDDDASLSDYGAGNVDLFAPGVNVLSLWYTSNTATMIESGTSMSAPLVTGSLALLKAQFPSDTPRQLINRLLRHVVPKPEFIGRAQTGGRLDLAAALTSAPGDNTPFNDNFANRAHLAGTALAVRSSNVGASREAGEPAIVNGFTGGASLWWDWTAPVSGLVTVTTAGSAYPALLGIYTGTSLAALVPVTSGIGSAAGTTISFAAQAGTTYEIALDGQNGATGLSLFNLNYANDSFSTPVILSGGSIGITASNVGATREAGEPSILVQPGGHSVWYSWTAPKTGQFQVSAYSHAFDPLLAIYTGSAVGSLSLVAADEGAPIAPSAAEPASLCLCTFNANAGTTYRITVDGQTDPGTGLGAGQFALTIADSLWQATTGDAVTCAPAVGADGTVFVGGVDGVFYAFNPDGSTKWSYATGSAGAKGTFDTSAAAVGADGTVYAASNVYATATGTVYAFTPSGTVKWTYAIPTPPDPTLEGLVESAPALASVVTADDTLYLRAEDNNLYALNTADGTLKWTFNIPGASYAAPSVAPDGTVYLGSDNGTFFALTAAGALKWTFTAASSIYTGAAVDAAGNLYFGTLGGTFYALNSAGRELWSFSANNSISSSPALGANGAVYFGSYDQHLYALNVTTGGLLWSATLGGEVRASSPAIDANGVVYVGCYDNTVSAFNANGSPARIFATGDWVRSPPVISGSTLYFGSNDHKLYAFPLGIGPSASPWPMFMANSRRLGRALPNPAPAIVAQPLGQTVASGSTVVFTASAAGSPAPAYQWQFNGSNLPGATGARLVITGATAANAGSYVCVATNSAGSAATSVATLAVIPATNPGRLLNLSVNATAGKGRLLTLGFATGGAGTSGAQSLLIRATGPALAALGVPATLADPTLTLFSSSTAVAANDNWGSPAGNQAAVAAADSATGAFALTDPASLDAALVTSLAPGAYTGQISGNTAAVGTALAEVYDDTPTGGYTPAVPRLINLSANSLIAANGSMIAGFVIGGTTAKTVLIRATGPALSALGVPNTMPDPQLALHTSIGGQDSVLASNAGWGGDPQVTQEDAAVGAFALTDPASKDSVILQTLPPGAYTAVASSVSGGAGIALIEIYEVP